MLIRRQFIIIEGIRVFVYFNHMGHSFNILQSNSVSGVFNLNVNGGHKGYQIFFSDFSLDDSWIFSCIEYITKKIRWRRHFEWILISKVGDETYSG